MITTLIVLVLFGLLLIMLEAFVPGGILGTFGVISILSAVAVTLFSNLGNRVDVILRENFRSVTSKTESPFLGQPGAPPEPQAPAAEVSRVEACFVAVSFLESLAQLELQEVALHR